MYKGLAGNVKDAQILLNLSSSDLLLSARHKPAFDEWFNSIEFSFWIKWLKPIAKKWAWRGYFQLVKRHESYDKGILSVLNEQDISIMRVDEAELGNKWAACNSPLDCLIMHNGDWTVGDSPAEAFHKIKLVENENI